MFLGQEWYLKAIHCSFQWVKKYDKEEAPSPICLSLSIIWKISVTKNGEQKENSSM